MNQPPNLRDLSLLEKLTPLLDELIELSQKGGTMAMRSRYLASEANRKAGHLKTTLLSLQAALANPDDSPSVLPPDQPLWKLMTERKEYRAIAQFVRYDGCHEQDLHAFARSLSPEIDSQRVVQAWFHLTMVDRGTCWVTLRHEVRKGCRLVCGPPPGDPAYDLFWSTRGGPPRLRSPSDPRPAPEVVPDEPPKEEPAKEEKPKRTRGKKEAS